MKAFQPGIQARFAAVVFLTAASSIAQILPGPGCAVSQAWTVQENMYTDTLGYSNTDYPDANVTYWSRYIYEGPPGNQGNITIHGQYPASRYFSFSVEDGDGNALGELNDSGIVPDAGQNNPFQTAGPQGTYTFTVVWGNQPPFPPPNTLYAGSQRLVEIAYRVYYPNVPGTPNGGTTNPILPTITVNQTTMPVCGVQPYYSPITATVWGRLDQSDFSGVKPPAGPSATNPPQWSLFATSAEPNGLDGNLNDTYMTAYLSRDFMTASGTNLVVVRFLAPLFPDTQAGIPSYAAGQQVRYWSLCTDEPLATAVSRCVPDDQAASRNGYVTFVISDPSSRPSANVLSRYGATWIAWGALQYAGDFLYDRNYQQMTSAGGAFYYNALVYRQTLASPSFTQSMANIATLPPSQQRAAMGAYWPVSGYCTSAQFQSMGPSCIGQQSKPVGP